MTKEEYSRFKELIKKHRSDLTKQESEARESYIEANKPCEVGQNIEVINYAGRKIEGSAKGFSIGNDLEVYVDSISPLKGNTIYLSKPHKTIKLL